nr:aquaporin [Gemmatimonadales bacterium]
VMVSATMYISGGLLNPALTIALAVARRLDLKSMAAYIVAQCIGAVLGAFMVKLCYPTGVARVMMYGMPVIANTVTTTQAIGVEALLTFFLMTAVLGTAVSPVAPRIGGFGIGLTLYFCIMVGGALTGPAVNPARALGPAVVAGAWTGQGVYWIGPIIGAIIAAVLWDRVLLPPLEKVAVEA